MGNDFLVSADEIGLLGVAFLLDVLGQDLANADDDHAAEPQ